jgi:hypothetical protein
MLLGALWGWLPQVNGSTEQDTFETIIGAVVGFGIGLVLDLAVHEPEK